MAERHIHGIGIDTPSIDYGPSQDFVVHRIINSAGLYGLENVAQLEELPPSGGSLMALPMKIAGGTGAPVRIPSPFFRSNWSKSLPDMFLRRLLIMP